MKKLSKKKLSIGTIVAAVAVLAACAGDGASKSGSTPSAAPLVPSGFLSDYSKLRPVDGVEGTYRYIDTSVNLRAYDKVMIDPVKLVLAPGADAAHVNPGTMQGLSDAIRTEFVGALLPSYQVDVGALSGYRIVSQPGPDVIRVRLAITGIQPARTDLTATDFIPIKAVFNVARNAAGESPRVAELTAEIEVLDPTGRVVAEAVSTRKSDKTLAQGENITWKDLQGIAASWAKNFRKQIDRLRDYAAK
jgi:hypothetical protein